MKYTVMPVNGAETINVIKQKNNREQFKRIKML